MVIGAEFCNGGSMNGNDRRFGLDGALRLLGVVACGLLAIPLLTGCGCAQVDEGNRGIYQVWGKVDGEPLKPGLHWYNPFTSGVHELDVREQKLEAQTSCFTADTQKVDVTFAVTYYPNPEKIAALYSQFGNDWDKKIVPQVIAGALKDAVGRYKADDLVSKREEVRTAAQSEITEGLAPRHVLVTKLDLTNLDFDDAYEKAVEEKVVAVQNAAKAKNKTVQVEEEAKQRVAAAKADAEAMRIKTQALSQSKSLVEYEIAQKWDGKLPQYMFGGSVPLINLDAVKK